MTAPHTVPTVTDHTVTDVDLRTIYKHVIPIILDHLGLDRLNTITLSVGVNAITAEVFQLDENGVRMRVTEDSPVFLTEKRVYPRPVD